MRCSSTRGASLLLAALGLAAAAVSGSAAPLSLDVVAGWGGALKADRWSPLVVSVDNAGPATDADLEVTVAAGSPLLGTSSSRTVRIPLALPARSTKRLTLAVPIPRDARTASVTVASAASDKGPAAGRSRDPLRGLLARQEIPLRGSIVTERIVVAISSDLSLDFLASAAEADAPTRLVYPHPEILPDSRAGWDAVDMVVFRDTSFSRLRPAQVEALRQWVLSGGTLVISGGAPALDLAAEGLGSLCPVEVTGIEERAGLPSLAAMAPGPPPRARVVIAASRPRPAARVLAAEDGDPVVAVRRLGDGSVAFLAFDAADRSLAAWDGRPALWRALASYSTKQVREGTEPRTALEDPWIAPLTRTRVFSFRSRAVVLAFFGGYAALLAVLLLVPWPGMRRVRVAALLAVAAAAGVTAWVVFDRSLLREGFVTLEAGLLQLSPGDGQARLERRLAVVAAAAGTPRIDVGSGDAMISEVAAGRAAGGLTVEAADRLAIVDLVLGRYTSRLFSLQEVVPLGLDGSLDSSGERIDLAVSNGMTVPVHGAWLVAGGRAFPLGELAPGSRFSRRLERGEGARGIAVEDSVRRAFWQRVGAPVVSGGPAVVGWLDRPPASARAQPGGPSVSLCLVVLRFR